MTTKLKSVPRYSDNNASKNQGNLISILIKNHKKKLI